MATVGEARYKLTADNKKFKTDIEDSKKSVQDMAKESGKSMEKDFTSSFIKANLAVEAIKFALGAIGKVVSAVVTGMVELGKKTVETFVNLAREGGKVSDVMVGFKKNFTNSTEALDQLRKASNGTINDYNLMLSANKAFMLGVTKDSTELAKLLEIARARGQALGVDTTQAFSDIVTGIGRASPLILDNLGITTQKYQEQKAALEATGIEVDDNMAKQLLLASVLEDNVGPAVESTTSIVDRMRTWWENLRMEIGLKVSPIFNNLANAVFPWVQQKVEQLRSAIENWWANNKKVVMPKINELRDALLQVKDKIDKLLNPTKDQTKAFEDMANSVTSDFIDNLKSIVSMVGAWIQYLIDNPDAISNFVDDIKSFSSTVKGAVTWTTKLVSDVEKLIGGMKTANTWVQRLSTWGMSDIIAMTSEINKNLSIVGKNRAVGDSSFQGGWTMVGERGPELMKLPAGSKIVNHTSTKNMISNATAGGSTVVNVNMNGAVISDRRTADDYAEQIGDSIISRLRKVKRSYG